MGMVGDCWKGGRVVVGRGWGEWLAFLLFVGVRGGWFGVCDDAVMEVSGCFWIKSGMCFKELLLSVMKSHSHTRYIYLPFL